MDRPGEDDNSEFIVGIAILLVITIFAVAVVTGWYLSSRTKNLTPLIVVGAGDFLSPCTTTSCVDGFICDGTTFTCKRSVGMTCGDFTDCATGLICSGLCATGNTGGLNQLCPCDTGYICTLQTNSLTLCKGGGGTRCTSNNDCASGLCQNNNTCAAGAPNSYPCTSDLQCASNNCSSGFCQNSGVISGTLGSSCAGRCVGFTGAQCNSTISRPLACECLGGTGAPGTCVAATQGIISVCSTVTACSDELVCYNRNAVDCEQGQTGCICTFPYNDPNAVTAATVCINGMSPINTQCFNNDGLGCDSGGLCVNSLCGGPSVLAVYKFSMGNTGLGTNFVGATTTSILAAMPGPSGNIQPYKMIGLTNVDGNDIIYLIDHIQGLLYTIYDPINLVIITPWTVLIPYVTTTTVGASTVTKTLIDVGYNNSNYLVAFNETITEPNVSTRQNDTVYFGSNPSALIPFNVQSGSGITGTQYTTDNVPLSIQYIDISMPNDVSPGNDVLISFNGTIYIKPNLPLQTRYSIGIIQGGPMNGQPMTGLTGPARFYFDNILNRGGTGPSICPESGSGNQPIQCPSYDNISFIGPFNAFGGDHFDQVLQFSGNIAGAAEPTDRFDGVQYRVFDYDIYSPISSGMPSAGAIMLNNSYTNNNLIDNVVAVSLGGNSTPLAYRISNTFRCVATANAFYILSIASCS